LKRTSTRAISKNRKGELANFFLCAEKMSSGIVTQEKTLREIAEKDQKRDGKPYI
jgi:hypothetical protein